MSHFKTQSKEQWMWRESHGRGLVLAGAVIALTSCAVGPDYSSPTAPDVSGYVSETLPPQTVAVDTLMGDSQVFVMDKDIPAQWWELFKSEPLNNLIVKALENNPDLQVAEAALLQAQENLFARNGSRYPAVDIQTGVRRERFSGASFGQPNAPTTLFSLYSASVDVSYDLDLFGNTARALEGLAARVESEKYRREAAYLALTTNVVSFAIQEASLREQIGETELIVEAEQQRLDLLREDFALGAVSRSTVIAQDANLAEILATLPPLKKELAYTRNQLSVLAGQFPSDELAEEFTLSSLHLPKELPVSLPSSLVQQRPDIRVSEALLHAANADVGVATANMFPQITLTGSYGGLSTDASDVFSPESVIWNIGAGLTQPIFRGGQLKHEKQAAIAGLEKAAAQYRSTVLKAFQNVANSLQALQYDAETLSAQSASEKAALENLQLTEQQLELGAVDYITLLDAQRQYHRAKIALIQSQAARINDTAVLFQALGGGWWNREQQE